MRYNWPLLSFFCIGLLAGNCPSQTLSLNLLSNGDFEQGKTWADGWEQQPQFLLEHDTTNRWFSINAGGGQEREIPIEADWATLFVSCRMRVTGVVAGDQPWQDARLTMNFVDTTGKHVGNWPDVFHASGTGDWVLYERKFEIPNGASGLRLGPHMLGRAGRAEFDDVVVKVVQRRPPKTDLPLPEGLDNPWAMSPAWRLSSATRERICLNGLWRFLPVVTGEAVATAPPGDRVGWGWFKVPGLWPEGEQRWDGDPAAQAFLLPESTASVLNLSSLSQAWYRRELVVPEDWKGHRVFIDFSLVQTHVSVLVDGKPAGSRFFPGGRVEITDAVKFGERQVLDILLTARPLSRSSDGFMDEKEANRRSVSVALKGITGDVFIESEPRSDHISDIRVIPSVRNRNLALDVALDCISGKRRLSARILRQGVAVLKFTSPPFDSASLRDGHLQFSTEWANPALWDPATPSNLYEVVVALENESGSVMDESLPESFGFREFWIEGRDFFLNGIRTPLRALSVSNMSGAADRASVTGGRLTCERLKSLGFNAFITSNYDFSPGAVSYIDGLLTAADETGVLCSFSLPHIKDFDQKLDDPAQAERYRLLAEWLIRRVQNHPSVVLYAMNHNATGYKGDQNPLRLDGRFDPESPAIGGVPSHTREQARKAESIVKSLDPTRPVYHHESGNLGDMHTINIYLNWAPVQERSDWLETWAKNGTKPLFFVEWGLPHIASWSSYRGPEFIWGAKARQSVWDSEFAATFVGDTAYKMTTEKGALLDREARLWSSKDPFSWSSLLQQLLPLKETFVDIMALYANENWRAHRGWRLSASLPWDQSLFWTRSQTFSPTPLTNPERFTGLQKPGIVPDEVFRRNDYLYNSDRTAMRLTKLGEVFNRWNQSRIGFIGGSPSAFTEKSHVYVSGEVIRKRLVLINDGRLPVDCKYAVATDIVGMKPLSGTMPVPAGERVDVSVVMPIPEGTTPGKFTLKATFTFGSETPQEDCLLFDVVARPPDIKSKSRIACYDPKGMTRKLLDTLGVSYREVTAEDDLREFDLFIVGREAIDFKTAFKGITRVPEGLNVLIFEQTSEVLEQRLGFRVQEHGLRNLFIRAPTHPTLRGIEPSWLHDWRGDATLLTPYVEDGEISDPTWRWAGFVNTRVWRSGNRGSVASVLIEKPSRGSFLPLLDGGFDLQYSPLLEFSQGRGRIMFCQLDVTGRTEADPVAQALCNSLINSLGAPQPDKASRVFASGNAQFMEWLATLGLNYKIWTDEAISPNDVLVVGPEAAHLDSISLNLANGVHVLGVGLNIDEASRILPDEKFRLCHDVLSMPLPPSSEPALSGISSADVHWRMRLTIPMPKGGTNNNPAVQVFHKGKGMAVLCNVAPWKIDPDAKPYLRTTWRRSAFLVNRLIHNLGATSETPLLDRLSKGATPWRTAIPSSWKGMADTADVGRAEGWFKPTYDDNAWRQIHVPGFFEEQFADLASYDGVFWYRNSFPTPKLSKDEPLRLHLGDIDDESWVWLNGVFLGEVTAQTSPKDYWKLPREYELPRDRLAVEGMNVLVVRVNDIHQKGGIMGSPAFLRPAAWLDGFYLQKPIADDDPYRYFRW